MLILSIELYAQIRENAMGYSFFTASTMHRKTLLIPSSVHPYGLNIPPSSISMSNDRLFKQMSSDRGIKLTMV